MCEGEHLVIYDDLEETTNKSEKEGRIERMGGMERKREE